MSVTGMSGQRCAGPADFPGAAAVRNGIIVAADVVQTG
jgi:hypothetical protein